MSTIMEFELSKEFLERFKLALNERDDNFIIQSLESVKPADITTLLFEYSSEERKFVIGLLSPDLAADIISLLDTDERNEIITLFSAQELALFIEEMDSDDGADLLMELPLRKREEAISFIENDEKAGHLLDLLRYDEDVAGGLMAKEILKADINWDVRQCIEEIRKKAEIVEKIFSVYVVDEFDKLLGKVSLKKIILADDNTKIADIYDSDIISVDTFVEEDEVANIMQKYDLESIPVINARGKLVGRITIDDIVDVITESADEERQLMTGISSDVEVDDTVWALSKARLPWLIIGMVGGLVAAQITNMFDLTLMASLALFIPLIMATGGNVGIQSSSIVVQSLASKSVFSDSMAKRLTKVFFVAVVNGVILAIMVFGAVILIFTDETLAITVSSALFSVVVLASFMGTITPLILDRIGINPALASGPFITTTNDLIGLAVYFALANYLYNL